MPFILPKTYGYFFLWVTNLTALLPSHLFTVYLTFLQLVWLHTDIPATYIAYRPSWEGSRDRNTALLLEVEEKIEDLEAHKVTVA